MELLLVRHGQTQANIQHLYYGSMDSPLTDKGRTQARAAGEMIRHLGFQPDSIFLSALTRTHETLRHMGFSPDEAQIDPRLNEQAMGQFEGYSFEQIGERFPEQFRSWNEDRQHYRPQAGESRWDLYTRVRDFMEEVIIPDMESQRRCLVIAHSGVIRCVYAYLNEENLGLFHNLQVGQGSLVRIHSRRGRLVLDAIYNPQEVFAATSSVALSTSNR